MKEAKEEELKGFGFHIYVQFGKYKLALGGAFVLSLGIGVILALPQLIKWLLG